MEKPVKNPIEDQRKQALEHYDEASKAVHHWSSFVESAIKAYNPEISFTTDNTQPENTKEPETEDEVFEALVGEYFMILQDREDGSLYVEAGLDELKSFFDSEMKALSEELNQVYELSADTAKENIALQEQNRKAEERIKELEEENRILIETVDAEHTLNEQLIKETLKSKTQ
jgi:hypothetical protein